MSNFISLAFVLLCFLPLCAQQAFAPFLYGVASGDPLNDRVILWTHVSPADSAQPVIVNWRISTNTSFGNIVNSGSFTTDSSRDFSVKVDATNLQPGTTYYYDFETGGNHSAVGRTKTAPSGSISNVRFVVATCAKYSKGFFNAYARIGDRDDIDAVIHLGDYIYESRDSGDVGRPMTPYARCSTLVQFRTRYAQYHTDLDLAHARQQHPFINVWDDHETANDCWLYGSEHFPDSTEFASIKQAATQAYFEWIPIREDSVHPGRIYRTFRFGDLIDLTMLDTRREGRMKQLLYEDSNRAAIADTGRTILGHEQYNWLITNLDNSTARWRIIGQQVMMAPLLFSNSPLNEDQWDNYPAERGKLYDHLEDNQMNNVVVLSGDLHAALANDLPKDTALYNEVTGEGSVAVEFITPAIASTNDFSGIPISVVKTYDPHIQYAEVSENGYIVLDVTPDKVQGDYYYVATTDSPDTGEQMGASLYTLYGTKHFYRNPLSIQPESSSGNSFMKIYPNPSANEKLAVQIKNAAAGTMNFKIYDLQGKMMKQEAIDFANPGNYRFNLSIDGLVKGIYFLKAFSGTKEFYSTKFVLAE